MKIITNQCKWIKLMKSNDNSWKSEKSIENIKNQHNWMKIMKLNENLWKSSKE